MLRGVCAPVLEGTPVWGGREFSERERAGYIAGFSDERGHRRAIDPVLLAWMMRGEGEDEGALLARWVEVVCDGGGGGGLAEGDGGLVPWLFERGIEIWTEAELCALHMLGHMAERDGRQRPRLERATAWAIRELQPDNGTNHPWAFHVFARRWCEREEHEARMYAEQLLHNGVVQMGRPDRFSACVLWDSARSLLG
jgi:hypothetical protein